jgi:CubicO group peptidase (beta-lactamase class C family)
MKALLTTACFLVANAVAIIPLIAPTVFGQQQTTTNPNPPPAESVAARVDKVFAPWNKSDSPGCSLGVSKNGVLVYERGYGMANLDYGLPITPESVFEVASISEQFTAMAILILSQRGQLSLDDDVRKYITELPDYGSRITLRHLLTNTSGLREAFRLLQLAGWRDGDVMTADDVVKILARQKALNFTSGTEYLYNNGGPTLLAIIVKRVSGQSLGAFADSNIFRPLGMMHTHFHDDRTMIVWSVSRRYSRAVSRLPSLST